MKRLQLFAAPFVVFCAALLVRIIYNLTAARGYVPMYDAAQYERIALHILEQHCFCDVSFQSTTGRPPLWPATIALIYGIFGPQNFYVRIFLSILGSGTCVLIYFFARDLFGKRLALVAGIAAALYPGLFIYDGWLYSESLFTFLFLAFTYSLYLLQRTSQTRWMVLSGVALGLSALTRQNGLFILGLFIMWAIIVGWRRITPLRILTKAIITIMLITIIIVVPWSIRNYIVSQKIIPVATGSGTILAGAYNDTVLNDPRVPGMWVVPDAARPPIVYKTKCCDIWGEQPDQQAYAVHWIENHLSSMPRLLSLHFFNIWRPSLPDGVSAVDQFPNRISSQLVRRMMRYIPPLIFLLAFLGLVVTWEKRQQLLPIYLAMLLIIANCIAFYGSVRFRAPIEPMLIILATGALWGIIAFVSAKQGVSSVKDGEDEAPHKAESVSISTD